MSEILYKDVDGKNIALTAEEILEYNAKQAAHEASVEQRGKDKRKAEIYVELISLDEIKRRPLASISYYNLIGIPTAEDIVAYADYTDSCDKLKLYEEQTQGLRLELKTI